MQSVPIPTVLRDVDALIDAPGRGPVLVRSIDLSIAEDKVGGVGVAGSLCEPGTRVLDLSGRLVLPGLVNLHAHCGTNAHHLLVDGAGEAELLGATYLTTKASRGPLPPGLSPTDEARWAVWELLRGGSTTVLDAGTSGEQAAALVNVASTVGLRVYVGITLSSGRWATTTAGSLDWIDQRDDDEEQLTRAETFLRSFSPGGLVRGAVTVGQADTASDELLQGARQLADRHRVPLTLHAAQNRREVLQTLAEHGTTPITRLHRLGVLQPGTVLAHAVYLDHHPAVASGASELSLLAASGAAVAHCPLHLAHRGIALRSLSGYRESGVPVGLGTDTLPRDLLAEVGTAMVVDRVVSGGVRATVAGVLDAVTRVGAMALGRSDLGHIAVGGPADLIVVDLRDVGIVGDPIRATAECATRNEVEHVFVAGSHVVVDHEVPGLEVSSLRDAAQRSADALAVTAPQWHRKGRSSDDLAPPPFPHAPVDAVAPILEVVN